MVDGRVAGEVASLVTDDADAARFQRDGLVAALRDRVIEDVLAKIAEAADARGFIAIDALNQAGLEAVFDLASLRLVISVPLRIRPVQERGFGGRGPVGGAPRPPARFSGFLNARTSLDYVHVGAAARRQPLLSDLDAALRLGPVVLQGESSFNEDASPKFRRDGLRLIHDDVERSRRYAAGDIGYPIRGFQRFRALGGVAVASEFTLQPYRITIPSGRHQFDLERESLVEVLLNGRRISLQRLPAGRYDFRDFPLSTGDNLVQLRIIDPVRGEQVIDLDFQFDSGLLAPGIDEYAYVLGVPSTVTPGGLDYETLRPVFSAFHRRGFSKVLTLGLNAQGDQTTQQLGGEAVWASPLGNLVLDGAVSLFEGDTPDVAAEASYILRANDGGYGRRTTAFGLGYTGRRFSTIGTEVADNSIAARGFAQHSFALSDDINIGLGASVSLPHDNSGAMAHRQSIDASYNPTRDVTLRLPVEHDRDRAGDDDYGAFLSLQWRPEGRRDFFQATHDTLSGVSNLEWQHPAEHPAQDLHGSAIITRDRDSHGIGGSLLYNDYRAELSARHDLAIRRDGTLGENRDQRSSLRLGTALVFADGTFGLGRPVTDSFAILAPRPNLAGQQVDVGGSSEWPRARIDALGPAVMHDLAAYRRHSLAISAPDLPFGYDVGASNYLVEAPLNGGTLIQIGTEATVLLDGSLRDRAGQPVSLVAGQARRSDDPEAEPIAFFTNRKGRFRIDGLRPGRHEITLFRDAGGGFTVVVPDDAVGLHEVGTIIVE